MPARGTQQLTPLRQEGTILLPIDAFDLDESDVRARHDWAFHRGNIYWLWPETAPRAWQDALSQIEMATRQILTAGRATQALDGRVDDVGIAAYTSGMGPLLGYWAAEGILPVTGEVGAVLELHYRHNTLRMAKLAERTIEAVELIARAGIAVAVLKGMQTAFSAFPEPGTRPLSDIDLLIDPADREAAGVALREAGYRPGRTIPLPPQQCWRMEGTPELSRSLSLVHCDDPWYIDLQTSLDRRYSAGAPMITLDLVFGPRTTEEWPISSAGKVLSSPLQVLHLACHASCSFENLRLVRLVELALTISKGVKHGSFSWYDFGRVADRAGALQSAYPALFLTELLAPGTVCPTILTRSESQAPDAVRRVVRRLTPTNGQRVLRCSLEERFMWTSSLRGLVRQLRHELLPAEMPLRELLWVYRMRAWRVLRGSVTGRAPAGY